MRIRVFVIGLCILFTAGGVASAQSNATSLTGTIGGQVTILPTFKVSTSLNLLFSFANLAWVSKSYFNLYPALSGAERLSAEYAWGKLTVGSAINFGLTPPSFGSLKAYVKASVFDTALHSGNRFRFSLYLDTNLLPSFAANLTGIFNASISSLSLTSTTKFSLSPFSFQSEKFTVHLSLFHTRIEKSNLTLTGSLGGNFTILPSFTGTTWLNFSTNLKGITFKGTTMFDLVSREFTTQTLKITIHMNSLYFGGTTTFKLTPLRFASQTLSLTASLDSFSLYVSTTLSHDSVPQVKAGFKYILP